MIDNLLLPLLPYPTPPFSTFLYLFVPLSTFFLFFLDVHSFLYSLLPLAEQLALDRGFTVSEVPDVSGDVVFLRSFSNDQRAALLRRAQAIVYTPQNEHFGIVPVEGMYAGRPVIACSSGGPTESITKDTGYLCAPLPNAFASAYRTVYNMSIEQRLAMALAARARVKEHFSFERFTSLLNEQVQACVAAPASMKPHSPISLRGCVHKIRKIGQTPRRSLIMAVLLVILLVSVMLYIAKRIAFH